MRKMPPLNSLKCFEAAARNGSFNGAADELCVSVSAISHQIKQLESYLNIEVFHRKTRTIELTEAGKKYYPILRDAFERIADGTSALLKPQDSNTLTIQLYSTIAIRWLIPKLNKFNKQHPEINVRIHTSYEDVDFDHSDVDACIKIGSKTNSELEFSYLFTSELFPVCSPSFLDNFPTLSTAENLSDAPILQVYPSSIDWSLWLKQAGVQGVEPDAGLRFDSYDHALTTALQGLGIAMGMQPYVSNELTNNMLIEPFPELRCKHPDSWYFVCRKERSHLKKVKIFKEWLVEQIESSPELASLRAE
ncbi:transcriptional regulator GcvA [Thalassotalea nanhaiensis]|uniref:Transcriptional regulator GcvA n=1 Tax=Thalassotalea nanhaiensis TaxID=3065648 RepID=A0ABY9TG45_9GAMM|nr:transcriptional regulator GcvA [Colwelliaceae bacterium SQ345]